LRFEDVIVQMSPARPVYVEHSFLIWSSPLRSEDCAELDALALRLGAAS
jgi:hypothetical protein